MLKCLGNISDCQCIAVYCSFSCAKADGMCVTAGVFKAQYLYLCVWFLCMIAVLFLFHLDCFSLILFGSVCECLCVCVRACVCMCVCVCVC